MRIHKGTFKVKEEHDGIVWASYDGSYGYDFPFYVHRKEDEQLWTLSHMATGYAIKKTISLKRARNLTKALKKWHIFLMPTVETLQYQKSLLSTYKQQTLNNLIHDRS